ncbi:uncharacterized protein J4E78_005328 [Alternaria triticimaculans]|uniref:uncharacterized protein n=1 Tax=Alternaria triticimaculans TaxID=297637 RepID=UPI0020C41164|nr:uncharacterized protein J4E78_005328 [Alternaria triticimaculans]KAI4660624.1 hypothetical protein J4E78_005328 [Alternaria triticimaculans]
MGNFTQLPAELQIQIFDYLHAPDVKSARAVSRTFRNNATPALFRSIVACARYQALGAFQNVSLHSIYSGYVREIIFDGTLYDGHLAKDHRNYSRAEEASGKFQPGSFYAMRTRWKRYQELHKEQESMKEDGVLLQSCARGLENMQNISSIVYSPYQHTIPMEVKTLRDLLPRGALPRTLADNRTTESDHPFRQLIGAIFLSDYTGIRQLTIEAPREDHRRTEFSLKMFTFPDTNDLNAGRHLFRNLVKLDISLSILNIPSHTTHPMTEMDSSERQLENLAKVLEAAQELRHLSFGILNWRYLNELMWDGTSIPEGRSIIDLIGLGATWPKLRSLKLEGIYAKERDLCELIDRHKDTLRTLIFARSTLHAGLWIEVVNEVVFNASMITTFVLDQVDENHGGYGTGTNGSLEGYEGRLIVTEGGEREFVNTHPDKPSVHDARNNVADPA